MKKEVKPEFKISIHAPERVLLQFTSLWNQVKTPVPCTVIKNRNSKSGSLRPGPISDIAPLGHLGQVTEPLYTSVTLLRNGDNKSINSTDK